MQSKSRQATLLSDIIKRYPRGYVKVKAGFHFLRNSNQKIIPQYKVSKNIHKLEVINTNCK